MAYKISKDSVPHYIWGDDCDGWVFTDTPALAVKLEKMPPGTKEKLHRHSTSTQLFYILNGEAEFLIDTEEVRAGEGEGVIVPPGATHRISNEGGKELEFMVISQPTTTGDRTDSE
ncbi:MAG: cupin domain-containing protein [Alistipes sp.]|nr:cupin domain-containing protein [Alistipes sp.]